jgi:hypothetical protein
LLLLQSLPVLQQGLRLLLLLLQWCLMMGYWLLVVRFSS